MSSHEDDMDFETSKDLDDKGGGSPSSCSICLEAVMLYQVQGPGRRSIAKLICGHQFHLDCIGSAFNAKGAMQCPNCRNIEKGRWLYSNGHRSSAEFDLDGGVTEDFYGLSYSELPFGLQWCPFGEFTQVTPFFEERETRQNTYNEPTGNTAFGDHSSASNSSNVCPYLALHGFPPTIHSAASRYADSAPDNGPIHHHPSSLGGGQSSADMTTDARNHEWLQRQTASPLGMRFSRNDTGNQQRLGSFVAQGSVARGGGDLFTSVGAPLTTGEVRGYTRGVHGSHHIYQQAGLQNSSLAPTRRVRPRGLALVSSGATFSTSEIGGAYGFSVTGGSVNRTNNQDRENIRRHLDRIYGWGREGGFSPLPWIPVEGESQWWGPFNPNSSPQSGRFPQRAAERAPQIRPENGYQHMPPQQMPPFH